MTDLSTLLSELNALEEQLLRTSRKIQQQRELGLVHSGKKTNGLVLSCEGYRTEDGSENPLPDDIEKHIFIENAKEETNWYTNYFLGKLHQNYIGFDEDKSPYILSVLTNPEEENGISQIRAILWRKEKTEKMVIPTKRSDISRQDILRTFHASYSKWSRPKLISDKNVIKNILNIEDQFSAKRFKFGVIFANEGQVADEEFFGNEHGSPDFDEFLNILGDKIELKGWTGYKAGLDTNSGLTGTHSIYTEFNNYEIMFHVSTLLPFSETNPQQLERKRHIGNDIVVVIFQQGEKTPFSPAFMRTQFNHVFVIVRKEIIDNRVGYRVSVCTKDSVPPYGPPLPNPPLFYDMKLFRRFLLAKLINAETATYNSPSFLARMTRTLESLMLAIDKKYEKAETLPRSSDKSSSQMTLEDEVVEYGREIKENLKKETEHAKSLLSTREDEKIKVWRTKLVAKFPTKIRCGDSWGDNLVVGSLDGVFLIEGGKPKKIWDLGNVIQINVIEEAGLMIALTENSNYLYSFQLSNLSPDKCMKGKMKNMRIDKSKGCHMYAISELGKKGDNSSLKICAAINKSLFIYDYIRQDFYGSGAGKFRKIKEFVLPDPSKVLCFCDMNNKICVGFKTEFNLIDFNNSSITELFVTENKFQPITAISLEKEMLLCYNHIGLFRSFDARKTREYELTWTTLPSGMVYKFPFVIACVPNGVEVRTLINGKMVQTVSLPSMKFITGKKDIFVFSTQEDKVEVDIYKVTLLD